MRKLLLLSAFFFIAINCNLFSQTMDPRVADNLQKLSKLTGKSDYVEALKICLDILAINPAQRQTLAVANSIICQNYNYLSNNYEGLLNLYFEKIPDLYNPPMIEFTMWTFHKKQYDKYESAIKKYSPKDIKVNSLDLVKLEPYAHDPEFPRIFRLLQPFIFIQDIGTLKDPLVVYRLLKNYSVGNDSLNSGNYILNNLVIGKVKFYSEDLIKLEPYINDPEFTALFKSMQPFIITSARDTLKDLTSIYTLAKVYYAGNDTSYSRFYINKIIERMDPFDTKPNSLFYFGFGSLSRSQLEKARALFDRVFIYASEKEGEYLKGELKWWGNRGFKQKEIGMVTSITFEPAVPKEITKTEVKDVGIKQEVNTKPFVNNGVVPIKFLRPAGMKKENLTVFNNLYIVAGYLTNDQVNTLKLNNKIVPINHGFFADTLTLSEGTNVVNLEANDVVKGSLDSTFKIDYIKVDSNPIIYLISPDIRSINKLSCKIDSIEIKGILVPDYPVNALLINNLPVSLTNNSFSKYIHLKPGINPIRISVSDKMNNSNQVTFDIDYPVDKTGPVITILEPAVSRGIKIIQKSELVKISGIAKDDDGISEVKINKISAHLLPTGEFDLDILLQPGDNQIIVAAVDKVNNTTIDTFIITRKLDEIISSGKYYALIIGINSYSGYWPKLKNAVNDATEVEKELRSDYKFDDFTLLLEKDATRKNIMQKLDWFVKNAKGDDNLLIFYSGHGQFNKDLNRGYWVPSDATSNSTADLISNSEIKDYLGGIRSKHTLLITDACFAGDIFRGAQTESVPFDPNNMERYYREVYRKQSRVALTSGGLEEVMDDGKDGHSIFSYYLLKALKDNTSKYFDANQLFNEFKIAVANNSNQTPQLQSIRDTKDEGGQFIFLKKEK